MDERRLIRSIGLNVNVMSLLLCGITCLLSSCAMEIEIPGKSGPLPRGPKVSMNFTLSIGSYTNVDVVEPRNFKQSEPVTDVFRIAGDIYMYVTLEEKHPVTMRAAVPLNEGAKVRVVAYWGAPAYTLVMDYKDYSIVGGNLVPETVALTVTDNELYKFVAYSFNDATSTLPSHVGSVPFNAATISNPDLLWGITSEILISDAFNEVEITLDHLFSRVRVEATTDSITTPPVLINEIEGAFVTPSYTNLNFMANVASASQALSPVNVNNVNNTFTVFTDWFEQASGTPLPSNALDNSAVVSNYSLIHSNNSDTIALIIGKLVVNDIDLGRYEFRFSNIRYTQLPFRPGYSYALKLNFRRLVWAGSNIFWDNEKQILTFLPETTLPWQGQGRQGVYFMWGSLVGISPVRPYIDNNTLLYEPNVSSSSWSINYDALANIPHVRGGSLISPLYLDDHTSRNYLSEIHDTAHVHLRGDICKYLTETGDAPEGKWRMPNSRELGPDPSGYDMLALFLQAAPVSDDGKFDFYNPATGFHTYITKKASTTIFPAGLSRNAAGYLSADSTCYLSGSPTYTGGNANVINASYSMYFKPGFSIPTFNHKLPLGYQGLVKCVKIDSGGRPFDQVDPEIDVEVWDDGGFLGRNYSDTRWQGEVWY